jgi:hypothetical protein
MPKTRKVRGLLLSVTFVLLLSLVPTTPVLAGGERRFECTGDNRHGKIRAELEIRDDGSRKFEVTGEFARKKRGKAVITARGSRWIRRVNRDGEFELKRDTRDGQSVPVRRGTKVTVRRARHPERSLSCTLMKK